MAIFAALQSAFPKPTLVAELRDVEGFGRALDAVMVALNKETPCPGGRTCSRGGRVDQANENPPGGGARPAARRGPGGATRANGPRGGDPKETPAPEFRLMPGAVEDLHVPRPEPIHRSSSALPRSGPRSGSRGNSWRFSTAADSARGAIEAAKKKEWAGSGEVEGAMANLPAGVVLMMLSDPRERSRRCWRACRGRFRRRSTR